jgi:HNH endonuclease
MPKGVYVKRVRGLLARFIEFVSPEPNSGCWLWLGSRTKSGYGARFSFGRKAEGGEEPHRLAWRLYVGDIPPGRHVLHRCDVPPCVNPAHLYLGDHAQNMRDKLVRGRQSRGSLHGAARITESEVVQIRQRVRAGEMQKTLAAELGISRGSVNRIIKGHSWKHV